MHLIKEISETENLIAKINFLTTDFGSADGKKIIFKYFIDRNSGTEDVDAEDVGIVTSHVSQSTYIDCGYHDDAGDVHSQAYAHMLTLDELDGFEIVE